MPHAGLFYAQKQGREGLFMQLIETISSDISILAAVAWCIRVVTATACAIWFLYVFAQCSPASRRDIIKVVEIMTDWLRRQQ